MLSDKKLYLNLGGLTIDHKPTDSRLAMLVIALLLNPMIALGDDPCREMTVADCEISQDNIIGKYTFDAAICESQCKRSEHCQF